jgi:2-dehydro-3-deoxyphosphogluconate aldolase/(4S)-4-hydroxy-2-oxoglutarate aldolase
MNNTKDLKTRIAASGIIPIVRTNDQFEATEIIRSLVRGGFKCLEVTLTVPSASELIAQLNMEYRGEVLFGAGTVLTTDDAKRCIEAGSSFLVSPVTNPEILQLAKSSSVVAMAGALSPNEIFTAWSAGADFVKVFPVSAVGGASYIRSVKAVFPQIELVPTGGVSIEDAESFFAAGAAAVGIGSELTKSDLMLDSNVTKLQNLASKFNAYTRQS